METVLVILLAVMCTALPFAIGQRCGAVRLVSPMHLLSYFCGFGFLLKIVVYSFAPDFAFYQQFDPKPWAVLNGAIYLSLFILLTCVGYVIAFRPVQRAQFEAWIVAAQIARRGWLFVSAFGFALLTFALILRARGVGAFDASFIAGLNSAKQINVNADGVGATLAGIKTFFAVPKFAFVLLLSNGITLRSGRVLAAAGALGGLLVLIALVSGDRFELVELLVFALATYLILGGRIAGKALFVGGVAIAGLVVVSAYMTQLRTADASLLAQIVGSTYFLDVNAAIMVADRVGIGQLLLGESYTWWSFGWVPRAIWTEKPAIDLGVFFKRDIMQIYTGGAFNVTGPGEAFINFGWGGVGVGFVLGWTYRKIEVVLLNPMNVLRYGSFLFYPILFYPFVQATLQSSFSAFVVGAAVQFIILTLMLTLFVTRFAVHMPMGLRTHHAT
ncbi:oligosaccharide repeat unit polymerase [Yoonia maritima]|uniref:Oligosaccharide repeat unit polymerase n=1 Tax=Yoonia maritima TaxID=1435347 RepID=A0A2T0W018_9RHOB|nr:oligosaccharide repeat unit polymerase [Yoonia maritima]PRY78175.1 oligosaccharide repeat unit polymerase [Yoonia maritima]